MTNQHRLKYNAAAWSEKWHLEHTNPWEYNQFKADFIDQFEKPVHEVTIAHDLKKLQQTSALKEYTCA